MEIEDKIFIAKVIDKTKICKTRNKILNTEFLTIYQKEIIQKELNKNKIKNYLFFGGYEGAEGESLIIYPEKLELDLVKKNLDNIIKSIKIELPKELKGKYTHRDYLGAVMQSGLNRNRIGDIIVYEEKAYIIVLNENALYIKEFLEGLTKFRKAKIQVTNYCDIEIKMPEFEAIKISTSSMRLDNVVSEIVRISRNKALELLVAEKVFVNSKLETKQSKILDKDDVLAIRGKGKFVISEIIGSNRKGKILVEVKKYV